jgi:uncharacterized GH25 family protein
MFRILPLTLFFLLLQAPITHAHDQWIQQNGNELTVVTGHWGGGATPCNPYKIKEFKAFDASGIINNADARFKGKATIFLHQQGAIAATAYQEEGFHSTTPEGDKPVSKRMAGDSIETMYYQHYIKTLLGWDKSLAEPLGSKFEIVPLQNPLAMKTGNHLPILVYYDGKPSPDTAVDDGATAGALNRTDNRGRTSITVSTSGRQVITAFRKEPYHDPADADHLIITANLSYIIP